MPKRGRGEALSESPKLELIRDAGRLQMQANAGQALEPWAVRQGTRRVEIR